MSVAQMEPEPTAPKPWEWALIIGLSLLPAILLEAAKSLGPFGGKDSK